MGLEASIVAAITVAISASTTFLTVRQTSKRGLMQTNMDPDNPMAQSQKYMMYIVPFFSLTGLYWQFGLVLYWVTTNLWTLGQQYFMFRNWTVEDRPSPRVLRPAPAARSGPRRVHCGPPPRARRRRRLVRPSLAPSLPLQAATAAKPTVGATTKTASASKPAAGSARPASGNGRPAGRGAAQGGSFSFFGLVGLIRLFWRAGQACYPADGVGPH